MLILNFHCKIGACDDSIMAISMSYLMPYIINEIVMVLWMLLYSRSYKDIHNVISKGEGFGLKKV
jgi:hypothetical protein